MLEPKWLEPKWLEPTWLRIYIYIYVYWDRHSIYGAPCRNDRSHVLSLLRAHLDQMLSTVLAFVSNPFAHHRICVDMMFFRSMFFMFVALFQLIRVRRPPAMFPFFFVHWVYTSPGNQLCNIIVVYIGSSCLCSRCWPYLLGSVLLQRSSMQMSIVV